MPTLNTIYDVTPIAQANNNSCWAAGAAMILSWKTGAPVSEIDAVTQAGLVYSLRYRDHAGLNGQEFVSFAAALHLHVEQPINLLPAGYASLLKAHGPLWIGTSMTDFPTQVRRHIRVVRGIIGDGSFDHSTLFIVDPDGGVDRQESVAAFAVELENVAKQELGPNGSGGLYPQIIHA